MNGLDKITARIETDAVADAARAAEEAKAQADAIRSEGEAKAQQTYWDRLQAGVKATEDRVQRLAKTADMEARKSVLACKQEIVSAAFDQAEEKLRAMTGDDYVVFLASLAAKASSTGKEQIILSAADKDAYGAKVVKKANAALAAAGKTGALTLADKAGDFEGGLLLRDGSIAVNCTIGALIAQAREEQASAVAAELFS